MKIPSRKKITDYNFICLCNGVSQESIEQAVLDGADTLDKIFDKTTAGVGGCGGSCRPDIQSLLKCYQKTQKFPAENPRKERIMNRSKRRN
jgi:NAD(P)H-nitrite reductase large subunit